MRLEIDGSVKLIDASHNRPFLETIGSTFYGSLQTTNASVMQSLDESQNLSHNQNLKTSRS